ncbi:hypothetical protein VB780_13530 [Leptolyngbya sp. CCNP1308]|uniref:DUF7482 domain-containing protein n=1 Tax=Leptolyngbya sp. CCNP1308 TaxID=3110255 RepID=UPI002B21FA29|nr:hypothetical protein [Leptolyngbya sp. CCNP1308]MEA5449600.1 hypothetical protein [Leptolyngbya sp. CCNP1308]
MNLRKRAIFLVSFLLAVVLSIASTSFAAGPNGVAEANAILTTAAQESGRPAYSERTAVAFKPSDNVYVKSALAVDFTLGSATVTLPLYRGLSPQGESVYYILTEASDFDVAKTLGINYSPKMKHVIGTAGAQPVTLTQGIMQFQGNIDFSPEYQVEPGSPNPFPPAVATPGAIADAQYSSMAVMPSGVVLNAQIVHNASGSHDRLEAIDLENRTVTMSILDGFQGGRQYFYHLVTDVSADVPSVLEKGVFAPKLADIPAFGKSLPADESALLGFSPVLNGISDTSTGQHQGFVASLANNGIDPINVFPYGPDNDNPSADNNYSPLWDAHVSMWTEGAIAANKVRRITSLEDLQGLITSGLVTDAVINPEGPGNPWLFGLRPTQATINCPVIAHPVLEN